jgi:hypothetical protein
MDMTCHDAPAVNFKPFICLAMFPAIQHNLFVFVSDKEVYPVNNCKAYEIKLILIPEFIFGTHAASM